jgi:hypothetical protein
MATANKKAAQRAAEEAAALATAAGKPTSEQIDVLNKETTLHPDRVASAHGDRLEVGHAGAKCVVGFKVGIAYLDLQLSRLEEVDEQTQTGLRRIKVPVRHGPIVRLRGTAYPRGTVPDGFPDKPLIVAGAALNPNVDKDFMAAWLELNKLNPIVTNKMVFVADTEQSAMAMARELAGLASGFDPIDPRKKDPRMPKPSNKDVGELAPAREKQQGSSAG